MGITRNLDFWLSPLSRIDCKQIVEDRQGIFWIATDNGVVQYKPSAISPQTRIVKAPVGVIGKPSALFEYVGGDLETVRGDLLYSWKLDNSEWSSWTSSKFMAVSAEDGVHTFYVRAINSEGNIDHTPAKRTFRVDTTPPIAVIEKPAINQVIGGVYQILGAAADATDFEEYEITITPESETKPVLSKIVKHKVGNLAGGGLLATWDTTAHPDGVYTITLTVRDKIEGSDDIQHTSTTSVTVAVDNTPPTAEILSVTDTTPADDGNRSKGAVLVGVIKINGEIKDNHIAGYTLQWIQHGHETVIQTADKFESGRITISEFDSSAIYGNATIRLTARDRAGNTSLPAEIDIFFNNEGARPTARLETPKESDVIAGTFEIKGEAKSVGAFKSYVVKYAKGHNPSEDDWISIVEGANPSGEKLATWDTTTLSDGKYLIKLTVNDENDYVTEDIVYIVIDNTKPVIGLISPESDSIETGKVPIQGEVTDDNFGGYKVEFAPGANPSTGWEQLGEISESKTIDRKWRTDGLDGLYSIRITATDRAIPPNQESLVRTITLDNTIAEAIITSPEKGQVVRAAVEIIGTANDDNFSDYQVFWGEGDKASTPITNLKTAPVVNAALVSWNTAGLDGVYTIRLVAHDKSQHEASYSVQIIVDNTVPTAEIISPRENDQVGGVVPFIGIATDDNFKEYIVEYGEGAHPKIWIKASEDARRAKDVIEGKLFDWLPEDKLGMFTLRLTVTDEVDHKSQALVRVEVISAIENQEGGERVANDGLATIYLSQRSLTGKSEAVITINRVPADEIQPPPEDVQSLNLAYDLGPADLKLNPIKPATLQIKLDGIPALNKKRLAFFRGNTSKWILLGGTVQGDKVIIGIGKFGRYALMEIEATVKPSEIDSLFTCQPRVFSPKQGDKTTISFSLQEDASVRLKIYNIDGRLQRILVSKDRMYAGRNAILWDGKDKAGRIVPSGLYFITLSIGSEVKTKPVVIQNRISKGNTTWD